MQLLTAIAQAAPRQVTTKYGERLVIDATITSAEGLGQTVTIWRGGNDSSPAIRSIVNGSRLQVAVDSKGKYSLVETPADRATQAVTRPISPVVEAASEARPMGFHAISLPMESERLLRQQIAAAKGQPVAIEPVQILEPRHSDGIDGKIAELGAIYQQCLAAAGDSEAVALAIFQAAIC
jgi:hypothetical protein